MSKERWKVATGVGVRIVRAESFNVTAQQMSSAECESFSGFCGGVFQIKTISRRTA
jgi:hypothetical protein